MNVSCVLLAAGQSSRMLGQNKLLLEVDGEPLVRRTLREIQKSTLKEIVVVTGHQNDVVEDALRELSPRLVYNDNHRLGMHSSIRQGLLALDGECDGFLVCLSDQPYFDKRAVDILLENFDGEKIVVPTFEGKRGHPVLISNRFRDEILSEPDRDVGCSYLLKRYPEKVMEIAFDAPSVLIDCDAPEDYQNYLQKQVKTHDVFEEYLQKVLELRKSGQPFALAKVIEVIGSSSAKLGSAAIFDHRGQNVFGWVGGGCAERLVSEEALKAIEDGQPRTVFADLDDEVFGLGVACGGTMKIFIEPILLPERVEVPLCVGFETELAILARHYGWQIVVKTSLPRPSTLWEMVLTLAKAVGKGRSCDGLSMRSTSASSARVQKGNVVIVGRSRITEALSRHFVLLGFSVRASGPDLDQKLYSCSCENITYDQIHFAAGDIAIIASHTAQDPRLVERALAAGAGYVAMIGSRKRVEEVERFLGTERYLAEERLFVPAGLDIGAKNPDEIALSIAAEVLSLLRLEMDSLHTGKKV